MMMIVLNSSGSPFLGHHWGWIDGRFIHRGSSSHNHTAPVHNSTRLPRELSDQGSTKRRTRRNPLRLVSVQFVRSLINCETNKTTRLCVWPKHRWKKNTTVSQPRTQPGTPLCIPMDNSRRRRRCPFTIHILVLRFYTFLTWFTVSRAPQTSSHTMARIGHPQQQWS